MKTTQLILIFLSLLVLSCSGNKKEQTANLQAENQTEELAIQTTKDSIHPEAKMEEETDTSRVYYFEDMEKYMAQTPTLPKAIEYFRKNNRYKDWDSNDKKEVWLEYIVEKNGKASNISIKTSSGNADLDKEAVRLIKEAKHLPGTNYDNEPIRCGNTMIVVHFPPR